MKLSFSLSSSKRKRPSSHAQPQPQPSTGDDPPAPQFVTVFDPSQTLTSPIVSPIPNTNHWRAPNRMKNLIPPSSNPPEASADRFVLADPDAPSAAAPSYGLTVRSSSGHESPPDEEAEMPAPPPPPIDDAQRFKLDIENLPEDRGIEEFREISVEDFSRSLLAGYGWKEGRGIGRNHKQDVKVIEQKRWAGNGGLGFVPDAPGRESKPPVPPSARSGKIVRVVAGKYAGMKGEITRKGRDGVVLNLLANGEKVTLGEDMVAELGSQKEERCLGKLKEADRAGDHGHAPVHWIRSQIKVRVISKDFKRGRLYLKKGVITDVTDPMTCDVSMDESKELIQGVNQEMLETALPQRGGSVIVLYGRHKGIYGKLMEKDREKEVAVVRDADSQELIKVRMEQIAEFVGDPADLGY